MSEYEPDYDVFTEADPDWDGLTDEERAAITEQVAHEAQQAAWDGDRQTAELPF